jgi:hypothetical protein
MKRRTDTIDASEDAAIDARLMAEMLEQARKDGAIVAGGPLCFVGLTPRLTRLLLNGYIICVRARMAGLPNPYPRGTEIGNALDALAIMHMRAMDAKPQVAKAGRQQLARSRMGWV